MKPLPIAASLALAFGGAHAVTLDFGNGPTAPSICSGNPEGTGALITCASGSFINQSYGDVAGVVNVTYSQPLVTTARSLYWWNHGYNDLYGVLWSDGGDGPASHARIELQPSGGNGVMLTHLDFGAYPHTTRSTLVDVYAIGSNVSLFHYEGDVGFDPNHKSLDVNVSSANGLWIDWRKSAYNVGIDNVAFSVQAVPEAGTYALLLGGLTILGVAVRRRR